MKSVMQALRIPLGGVLADRLLLSSFFFLGTMLGAYVEIPLPFTPVPLTLQTFFVLLGAACLGRAWSAGVQGAYLGAGAAGISVFAGAAAGAVHLTGPTAGYLWAFLPASLLVGSLWARACRRGYLARLGLFAAGSVLILLCGTLWLGVLLKAGPWQALLMGFLPFVPGEVVKVLAAASLAPRAGRIES
jgi:biotin transport system substrate-specific component